jgi:hypothetical protein
LQRKRACRRCFNTPRRWPGHDLLPLRAKTKELRISLASGSPAIRNFWIAGRVLLEGYTVLLMYSLLQWYWQRIRRPEFNPRTTARALGSAAADHERDPNFLSGLRGAVSSTRISGVADAEARGAPKNPGEDTTTSSRPIASVRSRSRSPRLTAYPEARSENLSLPQAKATLSSALQVFHSRDS